MTLLTTRITYRRWRFKYYYFYLGDMGPSSSWCFGISIEFNRIGPQKNYSLNFVSYKEPPICAQIRGARRMSLVSSECFIIKIDILPLFSRYLPARAHNLWNVVIIIFILLNQFAFIVLDSYDLKNTIIVKWLRACVRLYEFVMVAMAMGLWLSHGLVVHNFMEILVNRLWKKNLIFLSTSAP